MEKNKRKSFFITNGISLLLMVVALVLVIVGSVTRYIPSKTVGDVTYSAVGVVNMLAEGWTGKFINPYIFIAFLLLVLNGIGLFFCLGLSIKQKKYLLIVSSVLNFLAISFIVYLFALGATLISTGFVRRAASGIILISVALNCVASYLLASCLLDLVNTKEIRTKETKTIIREIPTSPLKEEQLLKEEDVRKIVLDELEAHKEELHQEEQPAKVEEPKEEPADKEDTEEEKDEENPFDFGNVRRLSFQEKLDQADKDLQKKYRDLASYIQKYKVSDRISLKGDTYSYKRNRLIFIAISGKHMRLLFALDPKDYTSSTLPVKPNERKRYEELPLQFEVRSDLSVKRAKTLIDDVMKAKEVPSKGKKKQ